MEKSKEIKMENFWGQGPTTDYGEGGGGGGGFSQFWGENIISATSLESIPNLNLFHLKQLTFKIV